jgi:hypothetical protein
VWSQLEAVQDLYADCVVPRDPEVTALGGYSAVSAIYDYKHDGGPVGDSRCFNEFVALEVEARMIVAILEWTDTEEGIEELLAIWASVRITPDKEDGDTTLGWSITGGYHIQKLSRSRAFQRALPLDSTYLDYPHAGTHRRIEV